MCKSPCLSASHPCNNVLLRFVRHFLIPQGEVSAGQEDLFTRELDQEFAKYFLNLSLAFRKLELSSEQGQNMLWFCMKALLKM